MKLYPAYKDSGIEWIGEIPEHWNVKKLKFLSSIKTGERDTVDRDDSGEYPFFVRSQTVEKINSYSFDGEAVLTAGDGVGVGKVFHYYNGKFDYHQRVYKISDFTEIIGKFFFHYMKDNLHKEVMKISAKSTVDSLRLPMFLDFPVTYGTIEEQREIVEFIDGKTKQIDTIIEKKQKQIELLKEERTAIINQAVTKGLNPDVPMKNSGIEWLGEVPEHWKPVPLKYVSYMKGRIGWQGLKQSEFIEEGPYLITGMNFKGGEINWEECYHISEERYKEAPEIHVKEGDVLMTKDGTIGKLLYATNLPGPTSLNSHLLLLRPLNNFYIPKYLYYLLHSNYFQGHIENYKTGTTFYGITQEAMGQFKVLIFDKNEQSTIVRFLDKEIEETAIIIDKIQSQITLLQEYRTVLISNAVTGKIDVRNEVGLVE